MIGLGTIINTSAIVIGGFAGRFFGKLLNERIQDGLCKASGVATMFLAIAGVMAGMLNIVNGKAESAHSMLVILCLVLGALVGEILNIESWFEKFGAWLKIKSGNAKDVKFIDAFLTSTFTVCIGAMAIVGSITDGITGDYSILLAKSVLDLIIIMALTGALGKGCIFSAIPVFILQGGVTLLARLLSPLMTEAALANISLVGSCLIFCVGVNLVWDKKVRVANLLPALIFAAAAAFLPFNL